MNGPAMLWLPARAKLNLGLRIVGRRADGYHLLDTVFHGLALHDDVAVGRATRGVAVAVTADSARLMAPAGPDNLAVRALMRLQAETGDGGGFAVRLHKRIPHGAGLGGGSSDAAAALRLGNTLLGEPLDAAALHRLAAGLGADVPFFLHGGTRRARGIGDELEEAPAIARHFVLVVPPFACETAAVYKIHAQQWNERGAADRVAPITVLDNRDAEVGDQFCNDLAAAAERLRPELGTLRRDVAAAGYPQVRMTGSGSALFVAVDGAAVAAACRRALAPLGERGVDLIVTASGPPREPLPSGELPATLRGSMAGDSG